MKDGGDRQGKLEIPYLFIIVVLSTMISEPSGMTRKFSKSESQSLIWFHYSQKKHHKKVKRDFAVNNKQQKVQCLAPSDSLITLAFCCIETLNL
jgi:hypothetical protein